MIVDLLSDSVDQPGGWRLELDICTMPTWIELGWQIGDWFDISGGPHNITQTHTLVARKGKQIITAGSISGHFFWPEVDRTNHIQPGERCNVILENIDRRSSVRVKLIKE